MRGNVMLSPGGGRANRPSAWNFLRTISLKALTKMRLLRGGTNVLEREHSEDVERIEAAWAENERLDRERRREEEAQAERERVEKARTSYGELHEEDRMLCEERDGLATRLKEILEERKALSSKMQTALREYDPEAANRMTTESVGANHRWLKDEFGL
jgi:hypothetical protein